ncbi:hypothetical protein DdX_09926 [Ditylenchus destructor]|uniref:MULE transposase domain-containing protein n=1 Tax=Ditylenchus destructor TaxID=166010 RepID=A0AAD4R5Z4_9BILA|nr:hypothetical protein DdX_09926 [Ditylenchus destructor]
MAHRELSFALSHAAYGAERDESDSMGLVTETLRFRVLDDSCKNSDSCYQLGDNQQRRAGGYFREPVAPRHILPFRVGRQPQQLPDRSQATLSAFALMTKKDSQAYAKLFDEISSTLFVLFGSTGCEKVWHFDHELAAITSCQEEFKDKVTSCYFHFTKNCLTRAANLGLNQRLKKDPALRKWLRTLIGGVHLKLAHQQALWDYLLQHPPQIREYAAIASFVLYFQGQWNTEASRQLLNQYENDGPRTTNFSEGWNNTLRNQFGSLHPGLGEFLQSMQKELYRQSVESERLLRGQPIRLRRRKYREAEAKFAEVRQEYRAVLEANILLEEHIEQDEIQTVLIPFARKMAFCCATFIDAETLLERSAVEEELQPGQELEASNEENSQNSDLSAFFANEE